MCALLYRRQVDSKDGEKLSKEMDCAWIETSAKNNVNVGTCTCLPFLSLSNISILRCAGKVFELCLQEIERLTAPNQAEPPAKSCILM